MPMLALTPHDMLVGVLCLLCVIASLVIKLMVEDLGETWVTLLLWALAISCAILAGIR